MLAFSLYRAVMNETVAAPQAVTYEKVGEFYAEALERREEEVQTPVKNHIEILRLSFRCSPFYAGEFRQGAKLTGATGNYLIRSVYRPYRSDKIICLTTEI